jgi:plasmid stability protein
MPQLVVRNVEEKLVRKLKERAGQHGVSMEEEHRRILRLSLFPLKSRQSFKDFLRSIPNAGPDSIFERRKDFGRDIQL